VRGSIGNVDSGQDERKETEMVWACDEPIGNKSSEAGYEMNIKGKSGKGRPKKRLDTNDNDMRTKVADSK
jgi:hypothetical protein